MSASTFKNRIPKRKYRERAQPANRQRFGLLQKKKDYKERAKNFHQKQDRLKNLQLKASLRNEDEFYFKMLKAKKNDEGKHIQQSSDASDMDEQEFRTVVKTQNYNKVKMQRAITLNKIERLKGDLHMISAPKINKHTLFVEQNVENFPICEKFQTTTDLIEAGLLDVNPQYLNKDIQVVTDSNAVKAKYEKLANYIEKQQKLQKIMMKITYEKNMLTKERKIIKKHGKVKYHKFFMQRKR